MADFAARIGRVRMKNGGADVRVLESKPGLDGAEDWRGAIVRNARAIAEMATDDAPLSGYVVVGLYGDGCTSVAFRYDLESGGIIPRALLPAYVAEVIRRDLISAEESRDVFNDMFQWVE
jgi:hypothetical protein